MVGSILVVRAGQTLEHGQLPRVQFGLELTREFGFFIPKVPLFAGVGFQIE
jgi:hypothetical protein